MSLFKKILILFSLVIVATCVWIFYPRDSAPNFYDTNYKHDIPGFQIEKAASAKVYATRDGDLIKQLTKAETQSLLRILLDSANYQEGELGTPIFDREIVYYDSTGADIGMTRFSYDGQTNTRPAIESQTKHGLLKIKLDDMPSLKKSSED